MKAENIKPILEEKLCPVHDIHPVIELLGSELSISCCCDYFKNFCKIEAEFLRSHSVKDLAQVIHNNSHN